MLELGLLPEKIIFSGSDPRYPVVALYGVRLANQKEPLPSVIDLQGKNSITINAPAWSN